MDLRPPSRRRRAASTQDPAIPAAHAVPVTEAVQHPVPADPVPVAPDAAASALLATEVEAARERAARATRLDPLDEAPPAWSARFAGFAGMFVRRHASTIAALLLAMGTGAVAGRLLPHQQPPVASRPAPEAEILRGTLAALQARTDSLASAADVQALERRVVSLREGFERARAETGQALSQTGRALSEVAARDPAAGLAQVAVQLGRIEDAVRELATRLDAAEQRAGLAAPLTTGSLAPRPAAAATPAQQDSGTTVQAKSAETRPGDGRASSQTADRPVLSGWQVHDVRRGIALVEGPGGLMEVARGQSVPGLGKVESIERRGRGWAVLTSRGLLEPAPW